MRVLAFFFAEPGAAREARLAIEPAKEVTTPMDVAPLVVDEEQGTLLALTVAETHFDATLDIALEHGGSLVVDVPEDWVRPFASTGPSTQS